MARSKEVTYEQAEAKQAKAVRFLRDVVGDEAKADEIASLSVDQYTERKGLILQNPAQQTTRRRTGAMAYDANTLPIEGAEAGGYDDDLETWLKDDLIDECRRRGEFMDRIWNEAIIANEEKELSDEDAIEEIAEILNEFDEDRFGLDEDGDGAEGDAPQS